MPERSPGVTTDERGASGPRRRVERRRAGPFSSRLRVRRPSVSMSIATSSLGKA